MSVCTEIESTPLPPSQHRTPNSRHFYNFIPIPVNDEEFFVFTTSLSTAEDLYL